MPLTPEQLGDLADDMREAQADLGITGTQRVDTFIEAVEEAAEEEDED